MKHLTLLTTKATTYKKSDTEMHAVVLWRVLSSLSLLLVSAVLLITAGCGSTADKKQNSEFFTSGSREADQRASQRMAKAEQLEGSGESEGKVKKASEKDTKIEDTAGASNKLEAEKKVTLYERLGGEEGVAKIVDDFTDRALQDPRVNWRRKGIEKGGLLKRGQSVEWTTTSGNIALLKKHLAQFFALATGGPAHYEGKDIKSSHANMHITNPEFDAVVGDLKASLDKLQVPNQEQKELLAIVESTRPQIVTER